MGVLNEFGFQYFASFSAAISANLTKQLSVKWKIFIFHEWLFRLLSSPLIIRVLLMFFPQSREHFRTKIISDLQSWPTSIK